VHIYADTQAYCAVHRQKFSKDLAIGRDQDVEILSSRISRLELELESEKRRHSRQKDIASITQQEHQRQINNLETENEILKLQIRRLGGVPPSF